MATENHKKNPLTISARASAYQNSKEGFLGQNNLKGLIPIDDQNSYRDKVAIPSATDNNFYLSSIRDKLN